MRGTHQGFTAPPSFSPVAYPDLQMMRQGPEPVHQKDKCPFLDGNKLLV
jgi:hypothetical protein